jgi:hypothetical protein
MTLTDQRASGNGAQTRPSSLLVEPPSAGRRRRLPELALGLLLVSGGALGALLLVVGSRERTAILALSHDISRGDVVAEADLSTIYVGSDSSIAHLDAGDESEVVGRAAVVDMASGTVITPDQFADPVEVVEPGTATVGLSLEAGQLPSLHLAPGDGVAVMVGADVSWGREAGEVVQTGQVVAVEEITAEGQVGAQRRWWISLRAPQPEAEDLGEALAGGATVQLVLMGS